MGERLIEDGYLPEAFVDKAPAPQMPPPEVRKPSRELLPNPFDAGIIIYDATRDYIRRRSAAKTRRDGKR